MTVVSRPPRHPLLAPLVDRVWWAASDPTVQVRTEWVLPTCRAQVILSPRASVFVGPKVLAESIERRTGDPMVGVSLNAGAVAAFFGIGGDEARGATVALDALWPVGSLADRLAGETAAVALDGVEAALVGLLGPIPVNPLVLAAEQAIRNGRSATQAAAHLGADRRTLVPQFRRMIGVGPKHYERICRFNRAIEAIRRPDAASLASIAAGQGYADQAHLTREIRHFAPTSPARLHRDGGVMVNHVEPDKIFKIGSSRSTTLAP